MAVDVDKAQMEKQIILPEIHPGSLRHMHARFEDAMEIFSRYGQGKIDGFLTMTSHLICKEVQDQLEPVQKE